MRRWSHPVQLGQENGPSTHRQPLPGASEDRSGREIRPDLDAARDMGRAPEETYGAAIAREGGRSEGQPGQGTG